MSTANLAAELETMLDTAPDEWWQYVPCSACNARRQRPCQATDGPARRPHASRRQSGRTLHGTIWLLANGYAADVVDPPTSSAGTSRDDVGLAIRRSVGA